MDYERLARTMLPSTVLSLEELHYVNEVDRYRIRLMSLGFTKQQAKGLYWLCKNASYQTCRPNKGFTLRALDLVILQAMRGDSFSELAEWCLYLPEELSIVNTVNNTINASYIGGPGAVTK